MSDYPGRLYHNTPGWVQDGVLFHIRVRVELPQPSLVEAKLGIEILTAVQRYHQLGHWSCELFLLMPDHAHAMLAFPRDARMSVVMQNWKRGTKRFQNVEWQDGFFDHRLRTDAEANQKWHYIRRNPVVKNLCAIEDDWRWWWSAVVANPLLEGGAA